MFKCCEGGNVQLGLSAGGGSCKTAGTVYRNSTAGEDFEKFRARGIVGPLDVPRCGAVRSDVGE